MTSLAPSIAGLHRAHQRRGVCGLCGREADLDRTHIPPECAFNGGARVRRQYLRNDGRSLSPGRGAAGGLWVRGLCHPCNQLQGLYDADYLHLARRLRQVWVKDWRFALPYRRPLPQLFDLRPGAVARSVLISMFGLNPNLRRRLPEVGQALLARESVIELPAGTRLSMALFRGTQARISGGIGGVDLLNTSGFPRRVGIMSDAQVYFPPLSWELEDVVARRAHAPDFWSLTEAFGWADVSSWTRIDPGECRDLHSFCLTLPAVCHPKDMPGIGEDWVELVSDNITEILIADLA